MAKQHERFQELMANHYGSETLFKRPICPNLLYTEGVADFQESFNAYWFGDIVYYYAPKIFRTVKETEDWFMVVQIVVKSNKSGYFEIYREGYDANGEYQEHIKVVKQNIEFIDLPNFTRGNAEYKFFLELADYEPLTMVLLLPSEH